MLLLQVSLKQLTPPWISKKLLPYQILFILHSICQIHKMQYHTYPTLQATKLVEKPSEARRNSGWKLTAAPHFSIFNPHTACTEMYHPRQVSETGSCLGIFVSLKVADSEKFGKTKQPMDLLSPAPCSTATFCFAALQKWLGHRQPGWHGV